MTHATKWFTAVLLALVLSLTIFVYGISFAWPIYQWDLRLPSPDARYDLVVLRGDKAAFDSFFYNIYLFPHASTPKDRAVNARVWYTPPWRGRKYLIYSGYNYPMFRWIGIRSVEIDLTDLYIQPFVLEPVKIFEGPEHPLLISVVFGKKDSSNARP